MGLLNHIEKLRRKSRDERKRIAAVWAFVITGAIALIWAPIFFFQIDQFTSETQPREHLTASFLDSIREAADFSAALETPVTPAASDAETEVPADESDSAQETPSENTNTEEPPVGPELGP